MEETWTGLIRAIGAVVVTTAILPPGGTSANRAVDSAAAFARLKALEGSLVASGSEGRRATTTFEVVAGGTVVMEHYRNPAMPGNGHMVTAYHLDGADLILTHYCIAKNQPTLRAERFDPVTGEIQFEFLRASNLSTPGAGHMRRAKYRLRDPDHFVTECEYFRDGQRTMSEVETFSRRHAAGDQ